MWLCDYADYVIMLIMWLGDYVIMLIIADYVIMWLWWLLLIIADYGCACKKV